MWWWWWRWWRWWIKMFFFQMWKEFFFLSLFILLAILWYIKNFFLCSFVFLSRLFHLVAFISFIKFNLIWIFFAFSIENFFSKWNQIQSCQWNSGKKFSFQNKIKNQMLRFDSLTGRTHTHTHTLGVMVNETDVISDSCSKWKFFFYYFTQQICRDFFSIFHYWSIDWLIDWWKSIDNGCSVEKTWNNNKSFKGKK